MAESVESVLEESEHMTYASKRPVDEAHLANLMIDRHFDIIFGKIGSRRCKIRICFDILPASCPPAALKAASIRAIADVN